jgi:serine/threonine protein kinase
MFNGRSVNKSWWQQFEGRTIENKYVLRRLLGVGGFGAVLDAEHVVEGTFVRRVAVKLILSDEEQMQRQLLELVAASTLRHPSLLTCFDAGATTFENMKLLYLVMELADEGLQARLANGVAFPSAEALRLTKSLAEGLAYLHDLKRVHRDVKPANVLRVEDTWKLSDFGSIRESSDTTSRTGLILGTMDYMPPESFDGVVSPAWDMWSLGVLILRVLTGRSAYPEASGQQLMRAILDREPNLPVNLPAPFGDIIRGCLVKDHRVRCDAQRVVAMIERAEKTPTAVAINPSGDDEKTMAHAIARFAAPQRRRGLSGILAASVVLILAVIGIVWFLSHGKEPRSKARTITKQSLPKELPSLFEYAVNPVEEPCGPAPLVTIVNLVGYAQVTGADVRSVKVTAHKSIRASNKASADRADNDTPVALSRENNGVTIRTNQERLQDHTEIATDLEIVVPKGASIVAHGGRGEVIVTNVEGSVDINRDKAGVRLQNIGGGARMELRDSPFVRATGVKGAVELKGDGKDLQLQDISGAVTVNGTFTGEMNFRHVERPVHYTGSAVKFDFEQAPGEINYRPGQLTGSNIVGPIHVTAKSTNLQLTGFTKQLEARLVGTGDVVLRPGGPTPPAMEVETESGNIDLALPPAAQFDLKAMTEGGRAVNDYGPPLQVGDDGHIAAITGTQGGPQLRLTTHHGQVTVRKATEAVPPPAPPG